MLGQVDLIRMMKAAPWLGAVERMVRSGNEAHAQNGSVLVGAQELDGAIADQVELCHATGRPE